MVTTRQILNKQGDTSLIIAMEELAELQQALSKFLRKKPDMDNLHEEFADVMICMEWIKMYCHLEESEISKWLNYKQNRLIQRYENGEI